MTLTDKSQDRIVAAAQSLGPALEVIAAASREDPAVFCQFVLKDEETGRPINLAPMHEEWHDTLTEHERVVLWTATATGKAVPLDTEIPTPSGWTTMRDISVGDVVFGRTGDPCRVTAISDVQHGRTVYRVTFDDGGTALADADHRWLVKKGNGRPTLTTDPVFGCGLCACGCGSPVNTGHRFLRGHHMRRTGKGGWRVMTTQELLSSGVLMTEGRYRRSRWHVPMNGMVSFDKASLPIDPYVLGVWLGDGCSGSSRITFHESDRFIFDRCASLVGGLEPHRGSSKPHVMVGTLGPSTHPRSNDGLRAKLRACGLIGNKHIPAVYMSASTAQRSELLAGLLDTDGSIDDRGQVQFTNTNKGIALGVQELARSLGNKTTIRTKRMKLNGRDVGQCWLVHFTPRWPVFRLPRKLAKQKPSDRPPAANDHRSIVAIDLVDSVPVKCIAVDSPDNTYLMGRDFTVTHNTSLVSIGRTLWEIGRNPNIRILVLSSASGMAKKIVKSIKAYIENSAEFHMVFPHIVPDKSDTTGRWRDDSFIVRRRAMPKDPTLEASGFGGNVLGGRYDLIIIDDYLTAENTYSDHLRQKYYGWLKSTIEGRKTANTRLWFIGNAWHLDDAMHRYAAEPRTYSKKYPILVDGVSAWPAMWPLARIEAEVSDRGPIEAQRSMFCNAVSDADRRFKWAYIEIALRLGEGIQMAHALAMVPLGYRTVTGVDLAVTKRDTGDETAIVTAAVREKDHVRQILDIQAGHWDGPQIIERIKDVHHRYHSHIWVESNAQQIMLKQFLNDQTAIPVKPFFTGKNKHDPAFGIESLAIEFSAGKWVLPNGGDFHGLSTGMSTRMQSRMNPELKKLIDEMLRYDPASHTGDRLMATWICREGARRAMAPAGVTKRPRRT